MVKIGDLVMVIKPTPCCGSTRSLGMIFKVESMELLEGAKCSVCGGILEKRYEYAGDGSVNEAGRARMCQSYRLKVIPGVEELDNLEMIEAFFKRSEEKV